MRSPVALLLLAALSGCSQQNSPASNTSTPAKSAQAMTSRQEAFFLSAASNAIQTIPELQNLKGQISDFTAGVVPPPVVYQTASSCTARSQQISNSPTWLTSLTGSVDLPATTATGSSSTAKGACCLSCTGISLKDRSSLTKSLESEPRAAMNGYSECE